MYAAILNVLMCFTVGRQILPGSVRFPGIILEILLRGHRPAEDCCLSSFVTEGVTGVAKVSS